MFLKKEIYMAAILGKHNTGKTFFVGLLTGNTFE